MKRTNLLIILVVLIGLFVFIAELTAKVIEVSAGVIPTSFTGECPKRFEFVGKITSNSRGKVEYKWIRSDGAVAPSQTIFFGRPGSKLVKTYWELGLAGNTYTHWEAIEIISPNRMVSNKAVFTLKCKEGVQVGCIDPAAVEIKFDIVRRDTQFKGKIRITGIVKNIGNKAFVSNPNQAAAYLYELPPGATTGGAIRAQQNIANLPVGGTIQLIYERDWNSSSPSEGEFPPSFMLLISYDPDIYMDANKENDDCNQNNNRKDRSGMDINAMLR